MSSFIEGMLAGYGIAIPVGAVSILIVSASMQGGFGVGFMAGAGTATADFLYAVLASLAGTLLVTLLQPVSGLLRSLSGLVLMALATTAIWRGLRQSNMEQGSTQASRPLKMYAKFLGITLINPMTVVYFTVLIIGMNPVASLGPMEHALFVLGVGLSSLSWQTLLAGLGGIARSRLSERFRTWATILGNLLVFGLGLRILVTVLT
ncbi:MAG: LysE family transporter [Anaerolineales bacterium]|jgi:threonine/homoserine/homoserine lactone efflux protein